MTVKSLRPLNRPDNLKNQVRAGQSFARRLYLFGLVSLGGWLAMHTVGSLVVMDVDGLVLQDSEVVSPPFAAQVVKIHVRPGDAVRAGDRIATVISTQMLDMVADLSTRVTQARSRERQVAARLEAIASTLPAARGSNKISEIAANAVADAKSRGFSTSVREAEAARARYNAAREVTTLLGEQAALRSEQAGLKTTLELLESSLQKARAAYRDGEISSPTTGTIGPRVMASGSVMGPGDKVAVVYHGPKYVLAYLPTKRWYPAKAGQEVVVSDGMSRHAGRLERIEPITDQLPPEFQSSFRTIERQQVARITLPDGARDLPLLTKVKGRAPHAPEIILMDAMASGARVAVWGAAVLEEQTTIALRAGVAQARPYLAQITRSAEAQSQRVVR